MATDIIRPKVKLYPILGQSRLLADQRARTLAAIAGCVGGNTLIDTPSGSYPIKQLCGFHEVLSLTDKGIEAVPAFIFRKGTAQLYRLELDNGEVMEATADHYLLVESDQWCFWLSVGGLMQSPEVWSSLHVVGLLPSKSVSYLQESIEELCQSTQFSNAGCFAHKELDYQGHYSDGSYPYDGQLLQEANNDREPSPLSIDVLEYNQINLRMDARGTSQGHIHPYQFSYHPSRSNLVPLPDHGLDGEYDVSPSPCEPSRGHDQEPSQGYKLTCDSQSLVSLDGLFRPVSSSFAVPYHHLQSLLSHSLVKITSIKPASIASYYDMVVPKYQNYLAQGMVHHNTGGGKTQLGYWWLYLRMMATPGYGWGLAEPTFPMLAKIILNSSDPKRPDLMTWLTQMGFYPIFKAMDRIIETAYGKILLGSADNPDSMQGAAVKGYWLDEGGLMSLLAYQTALQRVSFFDGQVLISTTPYNRGWLKTEIADKADGNYIHVEKWRSIDNPVFPKNVYDEMRSGPNAMQGYRFRMMYDAEFERPSGMIYNCFDSERCVVEPFNLPRTWPRYIGIDYGPVHTAVLWYAKNPKKYHQWPAGTYFCYREYLEGNKSIDQHVTDLNALSKGEDIARRVGSPVPSEKQWRREYSEKGWHIQECRINDVELGIDRVWGLHKNNRIVYFETCKHTLSQKEDYHRKLDINQQPSDEIENKEDYHFCFTAGTLVKTMRGKVPIELVTTSDMVATRQGFRRVKTCLTTENREVITVKFSNGKTLTGTPDHPICVKNKGFIPLDTLRYSDIIEICKEKQLSTETLNITGIPILKDVVTEYISNQQKDTSTVLCGKMLSVQYLSDALSTTKMAIHRIMNYLILNAREMVSTWQTIWLDMCMTLNILQKYALSLLNGTAPLKVENGIGNMVKERGKTESQLLRPVSIVGSNTRLLSQHIVNSATQTANNHTDASENDVYFISKKRAGKAPVYNLTVEAVHEYYANGFLVSNCDAERYVLADQMGRRPIFEA